MPASKSNKNPEKRLFLFITYDLYISRSLVPMSFD